MRLWAMAARQTIYSITSSGGEQGRRHRQAARLIASPYFVGQPIRTSAFLESARAADCAARL